MITKILITGASGFLGSNLLSMLKDRECYTVYALSSRAEELQERINGRNLTFLNKDAVFSNQASEIMKDAIVINCAYPRNSTGTAIADGLRYLQKVFESAVHNGATAIVNISSQSVYSQLRIETATEETPICLESPYAVGKYAVELLLESICGGSETCYTNLRMASLIGPGFNQRIVNRFVAKLLNREPITIVRQEKQMGFLDVEDAARAILSIVSIPVETWKTVYNVGNGEGYTVEEIYRAAVSVLKDRVDIGDVEIVLGSDMSSSVVSYERLKEDTGFNPEISLEVSIRKIVSQM